MFTRIIRYYPLILQRYLLKEMSRAFLLAFVCFELFMFLGISVQLVHKGLDIINLWPLIPYVLLYACPYSLPAALLTATVVAYGRLCADNEISAIRTCGIHLRTIIIPVIFVGIIFSILTLYLNAKVLPKAYYWVQMLQERAIKQILAGHAHDMKRKIILEPYHVYIEAIEGTTYKNLIVIEYADDYVTNVLMAKEGTIVVNEVENVIMLSLRNGEFFKPNYRKPEDIPKSGNFEETVFEIPLQIKIRKTTKKFLTLPQLFALRKKTTQELGDPNKLFKHPRQVKAETRSKILILNNKLKQLLEEQKIITSTIKDANKNIAKHARKVEALKEEIKLSKQHITRAKTNIELIMEELKAKEEEQHLGSIRLFEDIIEEEVEVDGTEKIAQINEHIVKEQQRIQEALQYTSALEELQEQEKATVESATSSLNVLNKRENELREKRTNLTARLEKAKKQELRHETSITIHKRLSPSLSCLVFVLIGIPLGIKTRCGNILISIGISFLLVLILYYPLVMVGWVIAEDRILPVIPAMWGANIIVGVMGIIFFQQVFRK